MESLYKNNIYTHSDEGKKLINNYINNITGGKTSKTHEKTNNISTTIFNKNYLCRNKYSCSNKKNTGNMCLKCVNSKIRKFNKKFTKNNSKVKSNLDFEKLQKEVDKQKQYLENIIKKNKIKMLKK